MSTQQVSRLGDQLGWCITTKDFLNELNGELKNVSLKYEQMVEDLEAGGYLEEMLKQIRVIQKEFEDEAESLIKYIEDEHLDFIDEQSKKVQKELEKYI